MSNNFSHCTKYVDILNVSEDRCGGGDGGRDDDQSQANGNCDAFSCHEIHSQSKQNHIETHRDTHTQFS